jgi:hypothetical protein
MLGCARARPTPDAASPGCRRTHRPAAPRRRQRRADLADGLGVLVGQAHQAAPSPPGALLDHGPPDQDGPRRDRRPSRSGLGSAIAYQPDGVAQVAETAWKGDRLIVRRVRNQGDQALLFPTWRYHAFVTDRPGTATWLDADHRRHAVCELAIRDLKAGAGLAHLPSGRFAANAAWLLAATLAHNLLGWTASLGLGSRDQQTVAKTLRRTLLALPGRLTRSARRPTLHLPAGWPWAPSFQMALARLRCIPYPT